MTTKPKEFILLRIVKKVFVTGMVKMLPTLLVISILVIAFNFLDKNLGGPIDRLIKHQLATSWKGIAIRFMGVPPNLYQPVEKESYEEMVQRIQQSSPEYLDAEMRLEEAKKQFESMGGWEKIEKKALIRDDPDYARFLEEEIKKIRQDSGLDAAERDYERERIKLRSRIKAENKRREAEDWAESRKDRLRKEIDEAYPKALGILLAFAIIFLVGLLFSSFIGRTLSHYWERTLKKLPLFNRLYPYTKQLTEFLFAEKTVSKEFKRVVAVEYPRKGIYALGFQTGEGLLPADRVPDIPKLVSLFIPSSPTPFTGYTIMLDEREVIPLDLTVEEALRFCVTGGVIKPDAYLEAAAAIGDNQPTDKE